MTTASCDQEPAVGMQKSEQLTHFHPPTLGLACPSVNGRMVRESLDLQPNGEPARRVRRRLGLALYRPRARSSEMLGREVPALLIL